MREILNIFCPNGETNLNKNDDMDGNLFRLKDQGASPARSLTPSWDFWMAVANWL